MVKIKVEILAWEKMKVPLKKAVKKKNKKTHMEGSLLRRKALLMSPMMKISIWNLLRLSLLPIKEERGMCFMPPKGKGPCHPPQLRRLTKVRKKWKKKRKIMKMKESLNLFT